MTSKSQDIDANWQQLEDEITSDEGRVNYIYSDADGKATWPGRKILDPKTKQLVSDGNPTMGIGHKLTPKDPEWDAWKRLAPGGKIVISDERVDELFKKDIQICINDCCEVFADFNSMRLELQLILCNMMFNLGRLRFSGFENFIAAVRSYNYLTAAAEMRDSKWWRDEATHNRAERLRKRMQALAFKKPNAIV